MRRSSAVLTVAAFLFVPVSLPLQAAESRTTVPPGTVAQARPKPQPAPPAGQQQQLNPFALAAANGGASKCAPRVNQITGFVAPDPQKSGALLFAAPTGPDNRLLSMSLEVIVQPGTSSYIGAAFAPGADGAGCSGLYESVTYWNGTCEQVAKSQFGPFKVAAPLKQNIAVLDGGPLVRVFLMSAGQGCVSIKKEIVF